MNTIGAAVSPTGSDMATFNVTLEDLRQKLHDGDDISGLIENIHGFVMEADINRIAQLVNESTMELLIQATCSVPASEKNTSINCEDILDQVLHSVPGDEMFHRFTPQFIFGLNSTSSIVKYKFLKTMKESVEKDPRVLDAMTSAGSPLLISVCRCLSAEDSHVAAEAERFLLLVAKTESGFQLMFRQNDLFLLALREVMTRKETVRFRVYDFVSHLSQISQTWLDECVKTGFIGSLIKELASDDMLVKLTVLEVLTSMSIGSSHCLKYFFECGLLNELYSLLNLSQTAPDASFLFPAVLKYFGHLFPMQPQQCDDLYPLFLKSVFHLVLNYRLLEPGQRLLAFDSLAIVGSTSSGKRVLGKYDSVMQPCMKCFGECIREGPLELRARHLDALNDLFKFEETDFNDEVLLSLTVKWFDWMSMGCGSTELMPLLFNMLKQPVVEIRPLVENLFHSFIILPWAQTKILQLEGFLEYITAPVNERQAQNNLLRHGLVSGMLRNTSFSSKMSDGYRKHLQEFYDKGPYYKGVASVDIAMESSS